MPYSFEAGDGLKSTDAAARYVGLSASTLAKLRCVGGDGPEYVKFGRAVRYEQAALDRWVASHRAKSTSDAERLPHRLVGARADDEGAHRPEPPFRSAPKTSPVERDRHRGAAGSAPVGSGQRAELDPPRVPRRTPRRRSAEVDTTTRP
jgi:hypothetical protein